MRVQAVTCIELETVINAPIHVVFDLAIDIDFHARSMQGTGEHAIGGRRHGRIGAGETVTWRARHFGVWLTLTTRILAIDRPRSFVDEQASGPFAWFRHEHRFRSLGENGTLMLDRWEHRSRFGLAGHLVDELILGRYMRSLLVQRNAALRAEAEAISRQAGVPAGSRPRTPR